MYSDPNLDAPPPRSQFRRPWSPEPFDPYASPDSELYGIPESRHQHQQQYHLPDRQQRREASEASIEALDLADYARTLRARQVEDPYPPFSPPQPSHPPSSYSGLPVANRNSSRTSFGTQPPSLVSRIDTLSSSATHHTAVYAPSRGHHATRRPFSLPTTPHSSAQGSSARPQYPPSSLHRGPHIADPEDYRAPPDEIDISRFPKWSRNWYSPNDTLLKPNSDSYNPDPDIYNSIPRSHLNSKHKSPFDPGYVHDPYSTFNSDPYSPYDLPPPPLSSVGHGSSRDLLPWSSDPPEYGPPLDPMMKEERVRMLEREFGAKGKGKDDGKGLVDEEGKPLVGTVDDKGNLVTVGPKKRTFVRALQIFLAAGACIPVIYAAVAIKQPNSKDPPPPPAGKPPLYVLYLLSTVTLLVLLYMFAFRPCCVRSKSRSSKHPFNDAAGMGMMVLPVGNAGKKDKKKQGKKGKGKYDPPGAQDVQVNLIVDPTAFQPPQASESESEGDDSMDEDMPGAYERRARRKKKNRNRRRRGYMEGLAMEAQWKRARSWAVKLAVLDSFGIALWGAMFVFILTGKRCPSGGFNGWCNAYNVSTASACLLCIAFCISVFFDVQDLHASKQSPRTRTS